MATAGPGQSAESRPSRRPDPNRGAGRRSGRPTRLGLRAKETSTAGCAAAPPANNRNWPVIRSRFISSLASALAASLCRQPCSRSKGQPASRRRVRGVFDVVGDAGQHRGPLLLHCWRGAQHGVESGGPRRRNPSEPHAGAGGWARGRGRRGRGLSGSLLQRAVAPQATGTGRRPRRCPLISERRASKGSVATQAGAGFPAGRARPAPAARPVRIQTPRAAAVGGTTWGAKARQAAGQSSSFSLRRLPVECVVGVAAEESRVVVRSGGCPPPACRPTELGRRQRAESASKATRRVRQVRAHLGAICATWAWADPGPAGLGAQKMKAQPPRKKHPQSQPTGATGRKEDAWIQAAPGEPSVRTRRP